MKHYLNFKPSIVFRKGSSFMLKTSLIILYAIPLALVFFWSYKYFSMIAVNNYYSESLKQLDGKISDFTENVTKLRPAQDDMSESEKLYSDYRKVAAVGQTSWTSLFNRLEKLAPAQMRFKSISIRPDKLVRVSLEGETVQLSHLTSFLQSLFAEKVFSSPNLKSHNRTKNDGVDVINFSLEVDYAGEKGELP
ncbi:MAG: PilN domain-containing protein [Candidatus Riflebacteria bacterium]|nr:PilN domain-containing protein [Candidatus Riflebacteria bacterium]